MMDDINFPNSPRLSHLPEKRRAKLLATCYAFYAHSHAKHQFSDNSAKVNANVLGTFPVWHATEEPQKLITPYSFERIIGGSRYFFHRTQTEFAAIQFSSQDDTKVEKQAAVFAHLNYDGRHEGSLLSTFNVPMELLKQISLALEQPGAFPRFLMVQGTGQTGLLLTTNHENHRNLREHLVLPLPDLSLGRAIRPDDKFGKTRLSLNDFVLSCDYPMHIESGRSDNI